MNFSISSYSRAGRCANMAAFLLKDSTKSAEMDSNFTNFDSLEISPPGKASETYGVCPGYLANLAHRSTH